MHGLPSNFGMNYSALKLMLKVLEGERTNYYYFVSCVTCNISQYMQHIGRKNNNHYFTSL